MRVLRSSLLRYVRGDYAELVAVRRNPQGEEYELVAAVNTLFPQHQTAVAGPRIDEAFLCSASHRQDLLRENSLRCMARSPRRPGRNGRADNFVLITRESVLGFLKSRRIT